MPIRIQIPLVTLESVVLRDVISHGPPIQRHLRFRVSLVSAGQDISESVQKKKPQQLQPKPTASPPDVLPPLHEAEVIVVVLVRTIIRL